MSWASEFEKADDFNGAYQVYRKGSDNCSQPADELQEALK
jgi:hypothetical protein